MTYYPDHRMRDDFWIWMSDGSVMLLSDAVERGYLRRHTILRDLKDAEPTIDSRLAQMRDALGRFHRLPPPGLNRTLVGLKPDGDGE